MLSHHKRALIKLFEQCHRVYANPQKSVQECFSVQETLISKITYIERRIRERKEAIKILKNQLGGHAGIRLSKDEARKTKEKIEHYHYQIDEYQKLAIIYRSIGDALAFSYVDKWNIKPLAIKETPGSLSGKIGSRLERKIFRKAFSLGHVVLLNDITNCLRYGDITVPKDGKFIIIEAKSGKRRTVRDIRQFAEMQNLMSFFETDSVDRLYRKDLMTKRVGFGEKEIHHRDKINGLVLAAIDNGTSFIEVESGLFYIAYTKFNPEIAENVFKKLTGKSIGSMVSPSSKDHYYFPIILTIKNPELLYKFYDGQISIATIVDTGIVDSKLRKHNLKLSYNENDSEWIADVMENETLVMKIGYSLWHRLHVEFISLDWFLNEIIVHVIKSAHLGVIQ